MELKLLFYRFAVGDTSQKSALKLSFPPCHLLSPCCKCHELQKKLGTGTSSKSDVLLHTLHDCTLHLYASSKAAVTVGPCAASYSQPHRIHPVDVHRLKPARSLLVARAKHPLASIPQIHRQPHIDQRLCRSTLVISRPGHLSSPPLTRALPPSHSDCTSTLDTIARSPHFHT